MFLTMCTVYYGMSGFQITCVIKDSKDNIIQVGVNGKQYTIQEILNFMNNKETFFTMKGGYRATVYCKRSSLGNLFLTTEPDGTTENNLDFLPRC